MTIILERYPLPEKGELTISETVTIRVSADEAKRAVRRWLLNDVSYMLGAEGPVFVIGEQTGWQVPVVYSAPHIGRTVLVGHVIVDAQTGDILNPAETQSALEQAVHIYADQLPPFRVHETPADYHVNDLQPTRSPGQPGDDLEDIFSSSSKS